MAFTHLLSPMKVGNKVYKNRIGIYVISNNF